MNSRQLPTYWQRLRAHPGKVFATIYPILGGIAEASRPDGSLTTASVAVVVIGIFCWGIVLLTARTQPVHEDEQ